MKAGDLVEFEGKTFKVLGFAATEDEYGRKFVEIAWDNYEVSHTGYLAVPLADLTLKKIYKHLHEGPLKGIDSQIFDLEKNLPREHPVRNQLYRTRIELTKAIRMNRSNKDQIQDRWVYEDSE